MKKIFLLFFGIIFLHAGCAGNAQALASKKSLYQFGIYSALFNGYYDGELTVAELKRHGDTGLGTFDGLNGEMIVFDGKVFRADVSGKVTEVEDSTTTPFAMVTYFDRDSTAVLDSIETLQGLQLILDKIISRPNMIYAIRVDGTFRLMKVRSVPKQVKPYQKLSEVIKTQQTFEFQNIQGTLVGFYCPSYLNGVNTAGYHFHFLSDDRMHGGHVLECSIVNGKASIDLIPELTLRVSQSADFQKIETQLSH